MADAPPQGQVTRQISATRPSGREDSMCWFRPPQEAQGSISGISLSLSDMGPSFTHMVAEGRAPGKDRARFPQAGRLHIRRRIVRFAGTLPLRRGRRNIRAARSQSIARLWGNAQGKEKKN